MTWQTADLPGIADRCFLGYKRCLLSYILEMTVSLASLLMTDYRRRVLGLLLLHPDRSFHLREIARLTGTVPGTLNRELTKLTDAGLLTRERVGNQMRYAASRDCPIFEELASILRKTSALAEVLAQGLLPLADRIVAAFVFGSMASGNANRAILATKLWIMVSSCNGNCIPETERRCNCKAPPRIPIWMTKLRITLS